MLCREFAIRNGGELLIESLPGKGSLFTVKLPPGE
jgi:signal transduction histidine kinase